MNKTSRLIATLMATSLLAGCQSFPFAQLGFGKARSAPQIAQSDPAFSTGALADGREKLRQGELSAAAALFRIAALDPRTQADANNGLGIVYAKLDRPDLADRYFRAAASMDPGNTKFAANLARLQQSEYFARVSSDNAQQMAANYSEVAKTTPEMALNVAAQTDPAAGKVKTQITQLGHISVGTAPLSRVTRISRAEVQITGSGAQSAASTMKVEYRPITVADAFKPEAEATAKTELAKYPLRVAIAPMPTSKTIRPAYPVKINLSK